MRGRRAGSIKTCRGSVARNCTERPAAGSRSGSKRSPPSGSSFPPTRSRSLGNPGVPAPPLCLQPAPLRGSPLGAKRLGTRALPAPQRGDVEPALTGAQEALGQPSEAARVIRRSIFHVGAGEQRGRGGEGEAGGAREAGGRAEREPGRRRPGPAAGREQQTLESRGQDEAPPPAAAAGTAARGGARGSRQ